MTSALEKVDEPQRMTVDEFFAWEGDGEPGKKELVDGRIRAMSPASGTLAIIQANIAAIVGSQLRAKKSPCRIGTKAPVVPRMESKHNMRVPDLAVTYQPPSSAKTFPDPVLIVEILSPGNERETREAIWACATIPSLQEVMVVASEAIHVEIYRKNETGEWPVDPQVDVTEGRVTLECIEANLDIDEIYAGTVLTTGTAHSKDG